MAAIRIDGNDLFAVHAAVREARKYALENNEPVLIEAMTYRQGHHSTSDDSLRYRSVKEVQSFMDKSDPLARLQNFMRRHAQMSDNDFTSIQDVEKMAVISAMRQAERKGKPPIESLFNDVYHEMPQSLKDQQRQLFKHLEKYPNQY
jgi:2-oxoisovalerate dehydrogenase E1 component alpha subunit